MTVKVRSAKNPDTPRKNLRLTSSPHDPSTHPKTGKPVAPTTPVTHISTSTLQEDQEFVSRKHNRQQSSKLPDTPGRRSDHLPRTSIVARHPHRTSKYGLETRGLLHKPIGSTINPTPCGSSDLGCETEPHPPFQPVSTWFVRT